MATQADCDLVILGGGPAGCAAALAARRRDLRCVILDRGGSGASRCPGWAGPAAINLCNQLGLKAAALGAVEFHGLQLWSWDGAHSVPVTEKGLTGWLLDPQRTRQAFQEAAQLAGAEILHNAEVNSLELGELSATARAGGDARRSGRVTIIASGAAAAQSRLTPVPIRQGHGDWIGAQAVIVQAAATPALHVALGGGRAMRIAVVACGPQQTRVSVFTRDLGRPATVQLDEFLATARTAKLVTGGIAGVVQSLPGLAGIALEAESHVGKRMLICGDAGGFVAAFSHDGFYPGLRSAEMAAEVAADALAAPVLQDELATYSARWRTELADYLQMPNTDLGLLLPMVFSNPQMSARLARSFLLGQAF